MRAAEICESRSSPKKSRRCPSAHSYCLTDLGARRRCRRSSQMEAKTWNVGSGSAGSSGRLRRLPLAAVHLAHQHLHVRERLLLGPPLPLAADLDEVLLRPDLEADAERAPARGLLDPEPPGSRARHQLGRSEGIQRSRTYGRKFVPSTAARRPVARRRAAPAGDVAAPRAADRLRRGRSAAGDRPAGRRGGRRSGRPSRRSRRGGEPPRRRRQARIDPRRDRRARQAVERSPRCHRGQESPGLSRWQTPRVKNREHPTNSRPNQQPKTTRPTPSTEAQETRAKSDTKALQERHRGLIPTPTRTPRQHQVETSTQLHFMQTVPGSLRAVPM